MAISGEVQVFGFVVRPNTYTTIPHTPPHIHHHHCNQHIHVRSHHRAHAHSLAQVNDDNVRAQFAELKMRLYPGGVVQPPLARTPRFSMAGSASALSLSTVATPARVHQAAAAPPRGSPSASPPLESPAAGAPTATGLTLASDVQAVQGRESYEGYEGS